jgi:hypothetical protein
MFSVYRSDRLGFLAALCLVTACGGGQGQPAQFADAGPSVDAAVQADLHWAQLDRSEGGPGSSDLSVADLPVCKTLTWSELDGGGGDSRQKAIGSLGTSIEYYQPATPEIQYLKDAIACLYCSTNKPLTEVLAKSVVVVSPKGKGLESIPELGPDPDLAGFEGLALDSGFTAGGPPTVCIRHDSLSSWNMGFTHELIHLFEQYTWSTSDSKLVSVYQEFSGPKCKQDSYCNRWEMLSYFGQYYLAGYLDLLKKHAPALYNLCSDLLGDARVSDRGTTSPEVEQLLTSLVSWFSN